MKLIKELTGQSKTEEVSLDWDDKQEDLLYRYLHRKCKDDSDFVRRRRKQLLDEYNSGAPKYGPNGIRKQLGFIDLEYFGKAYYPDYFSSESPPFHRDLDMLWADSVLRDIKNDRTREGQFRVVTAPRAHAKSTNLTMKDTSHAVLYSYKHYIIILSDSSDQAETFLVDLRDNLESNPHILEDFGELKGDKVWKNSVLLTKTNIKIEAIGSGKKIRGRRHKSWRPDLIVLDDVENDENVRTSEQRDKLNNWFTKAVMKAGDSYTDVIYIGTMIHHESLLAKVMANARFKSVMYKAVISFADNAELWDAWLEIYNDLNNDSRAEDAEKFFEKNKVAMLEGTEVLWPEKWSYYKLMVEKVTIGSSAFNSELQNEPLDPSKVLFNEEDFEFYNPADIDFREKRFRFYGFVDPSLGKSRKSDYSAIITIAKDSMTGFMYVVDADIKRRKPSIIIRDVLGKADWLKKEYGKRYKRFGCETNQFQEFFKEKLAEASAASGIYLAVRGVNQSGNKALRIEKLEPDIQNKYIRFNPKHKLLLEQLKSFGQSAHDDGPDALEGAISMAKQKSSIAEAFM